MLQSSGALHRDAFAADTGNPNTLARHMPASMLNKIGLAM
jgi:hypothetical protein